MLTVTSTTPCSGSPGKLDVGSQCVDDCGASSQCSFTIIFDLNDAPVCSVPSDQTISQCTPTLVSLPVGCTDADDPRQRRLVWRMGRSDPDNAK